MLVSILIPCYNVETWIGQSIRSALEQDYPFTEIIVVDDGSTYVCINVIETFINHVHFHRRVSAWVNATRNQLAALARGECLQYLDGDDYLLLTKISHQVRHVTERAGSVDVIYAPVYCEDAHGQGPRGMIEFTDGDVALHFIQWSPFQ